MTSPTEILNKTHILKFSVCTHRHNFIYHLMIDGHVCTNECINSCDAYSLVLIHTNRTIHFSTVLFSVEKRHSAQIRDKLWDWMKSKATSRPEPHDQAHIGILEKATLSVMGSYGAITAISHTYGKRSSPHFSPFAKFTQLCCSSWKRDWSPNPYFVTSSKAA